jgi:predicted transcriptional regulator
MKNKKIKYCSKLYSDEETGYILPEYSYSNVVMNFTKRYHNNLYLLARLNKCSRDLIDWLTEQMDNDNIVYSNLVVRDKFRNFISDITDKEVTYKDITVKKAFKELTDKGLLINKQRGVFQVNPEYFFNNSDNERIDKIILKLEFQKGLDTKMIIETSKKEQNDL